METQTILEQLIDMSHELGLPENDLAMFGEGNTSARAEEENRFYVKASGTTLRTIDAGGFSTMDHRGTLAMLDRDMCSDAEIIGGLLDNCTDSVKRNPSLETMMHAFLLTLPGVAFVGHTHPTALNAILCSSRAEELTAARLFPEQVTYCGPTAVFVPYSDPGMTLARAVRERVLSWMDANDGETPRSILMQNHGLFALGATPREILSCTMMWAKAARVILGALTCGGLHALPQEQVDRLHTRPEEKMRQRVIFDQQP
ncbi:MAG: class II aldolase/adducin family protein [Armatimonadota bacterium]